MKAMLALSAILLGRPGSRAVIGLVAVGYALLYLWLTGDIAGGGSGAHVSFPAWERVFEWRAPFQFEPVGLLALGPLMWTFSPVNAFLALAVGALVGLNVTAGWLAWRMPQTCRVRSAGVGLFAAVPALLAGGACCAPLVLIWLGLPIAGAVASIAPLLIPVAIALLLAGLWGLARSRV
ncbi:hypothetical protein L861_11240 [Litchfieldella anticariensis FP35 = DSM 16096]|uniref:Uncharacterized protein n=1 Tax=Litchfieldella anticariensis (strain DSM 16096 / CECT 5854 / CIP 108499 / LMG 22089 / FP35) TaxID=1121939 RepID=S2L8Q2_LITA3|nr:hypothetical protein [Halomonas anticariensis]EPC01141.1 hypothetical protein L861_11240 [Halomonas anticariensis FP35 = DSM 16096]